MRGLVLEGRLIGRQVRRHWKSGLLQCGLSTLAMLLIILALDVVLHIAIVVAIASSAFIVFIMPHSKASSPRRVIGGHVVAIIVGTAFSTLHPTLGESVILAHVAQDSIAVSSVGVSIFLMVLTKTEHPPAAGTALGLVVGEWASSAVLSVLLGAVVLSAANVLLRPRLTNLF